MEMLSSKIERNRYPIDPDISRIGEATSVIVLRNPWTRLVSGFRDKVSDEDRPRGCFRGIGVNIVSEARGIPEAEVIENNLYPTFAEYARRVARKVRSMNDHFKPQYTCTCHNSVSYDFVIPLEHAGSMAQELSGTLGTEIKLLSSYDAAPDPRTQSSTVKAREWLKELDIETIDQLYDLFRVDFEMANYSNYTDPNFPLPLWHHD